MIESRALKYLGEAMTAVMLAACIMTTAHAQEVKPLIRAVASDPNSLDPADTRGEVDQDLVLNLYDHLVEPIFKEQPDGSLVGDAMEVEPNLAESWEVDGPTITFKLRKDVKFYPTGNPMTADDVIYSFTRLLEIPANGKNQAGVAGLYTVDQMKKIDDHTVQITFMDGPQGKPAEIAVRLTSMKFLQFGVVDSVEVKKHATDKDPWAREWLQKNVASTGPYYIAERTPNQQIVLKSVPDRVWGPKPGFDNIVLRVTGKSDVVSLIRGGVVDYAAEGLSGRQYTAIEQAGFPVIHGPTPTILRVSMAYDTPPFDDKLVRQAMLHAIPVQQIIDVALGRRGSPSPCMYNADDPTCNNSYARYAYDPDKAKALLEQSGKKDISFDFWYSNALPYNDDIAILIKNSLSKIGVTANLKPTPQVQLLTAVRARTYGEGSTMTGMYLHQATFWLADPVTVTNCCMVGFSDAGGAGNWSRYGDPEVDSLHYTYRNSTDTAARTRAYHEIQDKLAEAATNQVPLIVLGRTIATSNRIKGVTFTQEPYARYTYIRPKE
ncbi:ABC transporter substrate-binding protein [Verticiella sediminum]|uniref:ABC transporter substrate-binding protein n=1 Tax=Verticiella sediminum TaxID=1247510 RepID=A0A556AIS7_9BURK|nr:ABC transporter substrate-binding protein [Verticiella sediminum]TSH92793.1 ABC transporter substrate-binding protein [Verticiella sediminum]